MTTLTSFYNNIVTGTDKYYAFVGSPDVNYTPVNIHDDVLMLKRVNLSDVSKGIRRHDWQYGNVYTQYTKSSYLDGSLNGSPFYVSVYANGLFKIYKCLNNNNGKPSTASPALINRKGVITLSDGYTWVYMYDLTDADYLKFASLDYIPIIPDPLASLYATPNTIDAIQLVNGGYGYTYCDITISGDGFGASAIAIITDKVITNILLTSTGQNYTYASISFNGDGSGAEANAVLPPTGGHGSNIEAELFTNTLLFSVDMGTPIDYSVLPYGVEYNKYGLLKNIGYLNEIGDMEVDYVDIIDEGINYQPENPPTIVFSGGFDSSQVTAGTNVSATATPSMNNDGISRVIMKNNGKNYRYIPTVALSGGDGSGSSLTAVMRSSSIPNFKSLNVNGIIGNFKQNETLKQGATTAKILFIDTANSVIGIYDTNGSFVADTIVEGTSSGAIATTNATNYLNSPDTTFDSSNLIESYNNSSILRQLDQPETINIALTF